MLNLPWIRDAKHFLGRRNMASVRIPGSIQIHWWQNWRGREKWLGWYSDGVVSRLHTHTLGLFFPQECLQICLFLPLGLISILPPRSLKCKQWSIWCFFTVSPWRSIFLTPYTNKKIKRAVIDSKMRAFTLQHAYEIC